MQALKGSHGGLEETKAQLEAEKLHLDKSLQRSTSSFKKAEDTIKVDNFHSLLSNCAIHCEIGKGVQLSTVDRGLFRLLPCTVGVCTYLLCPQPLSCNTARVSVTMFVHYPKPATACWNHNGHHHFSKDV